MKNGILLLLFIFLVFVSIMVGYSQYSNKTTNNPKPVTSVPTIPLSPIVKTVNEDTIFLQIVSPENESKTDSSTVMVQGKTNPYVSLIVNDTDLKSDEKGVFSTTITLDEGENYISIVAYDTEGNSTEREIIVTRTVNGI